MHYDIYGAHRVIHPKGLLPQAAEKIDNNPEIFPNEILVDVKALQLTSTAFNSLKKDCGEDSEKIAEKIIQIVDSCGKFQDPLTKSGGMLIGTVKKIGEELKDKIEVKPGDKIATLISLSLTPLKIYSINKIDMNTEQVFCEANAVLFESGIYTKIPQDLGESLSLAAMDVAGAPAQIAMNVKPGDLVTVMGAGKAGLLCLAEAQKRAAPGGMVVCLEYSESQCAVVEELGLADIVLNIDGQKPLETYEKFKKATSGRLSDFTVSTVNVPDTELSTILVTDNEGKIFFFSMSTNFVKASLGAEGVKKHVQMILGNGYSPGHAEITFDIVRRNMKLKNYFNDKYCRI